MNTRVVRQCLASLFIALFCLAATPTRRLGIPSLGESIEVSIVNVDVVVTDKAGNRIRGLKPGDFEVYENGKLQPVSNFAEYGASPAAGSVAAEAAAAPPAESPAQRRTLVIFLEQFHLPQAQATEFVGSIKSLVRRAIRPGDSVAIVMWDRSMKVVVDFTDDVELLEAALTDIGAHASRAVHDDNATLRNEVVEVKEFERVAQEMAIEHQMGESVVKDPERAGEVSGNLHAQRALMDLKRKISGINAMISSMAGTEGRKMLVLGTHRLSEYAGAEYFYMGGTTRLDDMTKARFDMKPFIRTMIDNANASGVTIYPVYPLGLNKPTRDASVRLREVEATEPPIEQQAEQLLLMNETVMLTDVARKTGGLAAWGPTDIVKLIPSIGDDVTDYYSLAYHATSKGEDLARSISVRAKNPEYTVRSRHQFVERSDQSRMKDRVLATLFQAKSDLPFTIGASFDPPRKLRNRDVFPLKVRIPIKDLTLVPQTGKHAGAFSVYVVTAAELGNVGDIRQQTQSFEIAPADLERAQAGHFTYSFDVIAEDETDRVAIGVLDEVSKSYALLRVPLPQRPAQISGTR